MDEGRIGGETEWSVSAAIEDNNKMFEENLRKAYETLANTAPLYPDDKAKNVLLGIWEKILRVLCRPIIVRQRQMNALLLNMLQDLSRLEIFLAEEAYLKGLADQQKALGSNTAGISYSPKRMEPYIIQIVSALNYGDAVGNDVIAVKHALEEEGIATAVYTGSVHPKIQEEGIFRMINLPELREDDTVIYHFASSDPYIDIVRRLTCKLVLRYHNVTPPEFFHGFDAAQERIAKEALEQVRGLEKAVDYVMADSEFNGQNLLLEGYQCPVKTVPILVPFSEYGQEPDPKVARRYRDGRTNIIFVGRGAPNKKIEDVIRCFLAYKRKFDPCARLFLVGSYHKEGGYFSFLQKLIKEENAEDIIFPGHISFAEILAYYEIADVFLCMSEHEGFCVPLVEAMFFEVPIVAYSSSAVPETLGEAGILVHSKEPDIAASQIHRIVTDKELAARLKELGRERLKDFQYEKVKAQMMELLKCIDDESQQE